MVFAPLTLMAAAHPEVIRHVFQAVLHSQITHVAAATIGVIGLLNMLVALLARETRECSLSMYRLTENMVRYMTRGLRWGDDHAGHGVAEQPSSSHHDR